MTAMRNCLISGKNVLAWKWSCTLGTSDSYRARTKIGQSSSWENTRAGTEWDRSAGVEQECLPYRRQTHEQQKTKKILSCMVFLLPWPVRTWEWVGRSCMTKICSWIVLERLCFRPLLNNQTFICGGLQSTADNFVEKCLALIIHFPPCISSESFIISAFKMILFGWAKNAFLNPGLTSKPVVSVLLC